MFKKPSISLSLPAAAGLMLALLIGATILPAKADDFTPETAQAAAIKGDPKAQYYLARQYDIGKLVPHDYNVALLYLRQAADQGYAPAQTSLGSYYAHGYGVKQSYADALDWYHQAAVQREPRAEYCLGYAYAYGKGVTKNVDVALHWWQQAAEQGQVNAQNALGQFYFHGEKPGDTNHIDYAAAAKWLSLAAKQDCAPAMATLGFLYQYGLGVGKDEAQAYKWYDMAADRGDAMAEANLGIMYENGQGNLPRDLVQAYKWYLLGAEQGNVEGRHGVYEYDQSHALTPMEITAAHKLVADFHAAHPNLSVGVVNVPN